MTRTTPHRDHHLAVGVMVFGVLLSLYGVLGLISSSHGSPAAASDPAASDAAPRAQAAIEVPSLVSLVDREAAAQVGTADDQSPAQAAGVDAGPSAAVDEVGDRSTDPSPPLPIEVVIPAIDVRAPLDPLGLQDDGAMELPEFGRAGWYDRGPPPGEDGPAVIAAHLDDQRGPDVFYELEQLRPGDDVHVRRADGSRASFVVEELEIVRKEALPGDRIWAETDGPALRLITCGGSFDRATGHYESNLIVYARGV